MTYDHQPHVSRLVWKSFGALASTNPDGRNRDALVNDALLEWLKTNKPEILAHYEAMEDKEKEFMDGLKQGKAAAV